VSGHHPRKDHRAVPGGEHGGTIYRSQIHPPMTWPVSECRGMEAANHSRRTGQRPAESLLGRLTWTRCAGGDRALRLGGQFGDNRRSDRQCCGKHAADQNPRHPSDPVLVLTHSPPPTSSAVHNSFYVHNFSHTDCADGGGSWGRFGKTRRLQERPARGSTSRASAVPFWGLGVRRSSLRS
jgi:hypothetical protein